MSVLTLGSAGRLTVVGMLRGPETHAREEVRCVLLQKNGIIHQRSLKYNMKMKAVKKISTPNKSQRAADWTAVFGQMRFHHRLTN